MTMKLSYGAIATELRQWESHVGHIISADGFRTLSIGERLDILTAALGPEPTISTSQQEEE